MSKIDIGGISQSSNIQIGDNGQMYNLTSEIHKDIKSLFSVLRAEIEKAPSIGKYEKEDVLNSLTEVEKKINDPVDQQDHGRIVYFWGKIIGTIKDAGQIISIAKALGNAIGLPLP